jgi:hypothetical protein
MPTNLSALRHAIFKHRDTIADCAEKAAFDKGWGIVTTNGRDFKIDQHHLMEFEALLTSAGEGVDKMLEVMASATEEAAGAMLLRVFYADLLGNNTFSSKILQHQFECDDIKEATVVNFSMKVVAISFVSVANLYFMYTCLLYSFTKGGMWQMAWLSNAAFTVFATVFFYDLVTALIINFLIPEQILMDTDDAKRKVAALVDKIFKKQPNSEAEKSDDGKNEDGDNDVDDDDDDDDVEEEEGYQQAPRRKKVTIPFSSSDYFFRSTVSNSIIFCYLFSFLAFFYT